MVDLLRQADARLPLLSTLQPGESRRLRNSGIEGGLPFAQAALGAVRGSRRRAKSQSTVFFGRLAQPP